MNALSSHCCCCCCYGCCQNLFSVRFFYRFFIVANCAQPAGWTMVPKKPTTTTTATATKIAASNSPSLTCSTLFTTLCPSLPTQHQLSCCWYSCCYHCCCCCCTSFCFCPAALCAKKKWYLIKIWWFSAAVCCGRRAATEQTGRELAASRLHLLSSACFVITALPAHSTEVEWAKRGVCVCVSWGHPAYLALPENDNITIYGKAFMAAIRHNYLRNILSFVCFHIRLSYLYFFKEKKKKHSSLEKAL